MFMSVAAATADLNEARTRLRVATLDQWATAGVALLKQLSESGRGLVDRVHALFRISQAIRLAIALATRLENPDNPAFQPTPAKARAPRSAAPETLAEKDLSERVSTEKPARSRRPRFVDRSDAVILRRPLPEIVKVICRALGVVPDWSLWSDDEAPQAPEPGPGEAAPAQAPPPDPGCAIPKPPTRPRLILDRPKPPPPDAPLRARLRRFCAPGALVPVTPPPLVPTVVPASGRGRPPIA
jgi:hypothetical protein